MTLNTQQRIDKIAEELREIYNTTNEGPRLIAEMIRREFPEPRKVLDSSGGWGPRATDIISPPA